MTCSLLQRDVWLEDGENDANQGVLVSELVARLHARFAEADQGVLRYAAGSDRLNTTAKRALNRRMEGPAVLLECDSRKIY